MPGFLASGSVSGSVSGSDFVHASTHFFFLWAFLSASVLAWTTGTNVQVVMPVHLYIRTNKVREQAKPITSSSLLAARILATNLAIRTLIIRPSCRVNWLIIVSKVDIGLA